ncbi:hypothetical protein OUZ56_025069 [Daphnia magna]|uniref:Uncharacterized protein n=1 Tax=Daphnia magna TaxID=35525 RepID=A0ABQ9ZIR0_9CRUS|nr:hypothetical protein OUZ56_025069 [Daphnia magna]
MGKLFSGKLNFWIECNQHCQQSNTMPMLLQFSFSVDQYLSLSCDRVVVSLMEVEEVFHRISPHRRKIPISTRIQRLAEPEDSSHHHSSLSLPVGRMV